MQTISRIECFITNGMCIYIELILSKMLNWHSGSMHKISCISHTLQWRHNERDGVSNHLPHDCLLMRRSKKTSKLRAAGHLCGEFTGHVIMITMEFFIWLHRVAASSSTPSAWWIINYMPSYRVLMNIILRYFINYMCPFFLFLYCIPIWIVHDYVRIDIIYIYIYKRSATDVTKSNQCQQECMNI